MIDTSASLIVLAAADVDASSTVAHANSNRKVVCMDGGAVREAGRRADLTPICWGGPYQVISG